MSSASHRSPVRPKASRTRPAQREVANALKSSPPSLPMTSGTAASSSRRLVTTGSTPPKSTVDRRIVARLPAPASSTWRRLRGTMGTRTTGDESGYGRRARESDLARVRHGIPGAAEVIAADGFDPDLILSIARGGLFLAASLGYALAVKNLHVTNVEFYDGVGTTLDMPVMLPPVPSAVDFSAKKVLIADDVADSGRTMELVYTFIKDHVEDVRSAVIYEKPQSVIKCDYVWKRTDRWINFPWSCEAPVVDRVGQVLDA